MPTRSRLHVGFAALSPPYGAIPHNVQLAKLNNAELARAVKMLKALE